MYPLAFGEGGGAVFDGDSADRTRVARSWNGSQSTRPPGLRVNLGLTLNTGARANNTLFK